MHSSYQERPGLICLVVSNQFYILPFKQQLYPLTQVLVAVSIVTFTTLTVTCLAIASPKQPSSKVWGGFVNDSGWSNRGIVFLTGLANPNYGFGGLDGSIHLAEDCINATKVVPLATIFSVVTAIVTALVFAVSMLYCISDIRSVLATRTG